jgi:hypothetical protein
MRWITSTLMAWSFRRGYWFQPFFEGKNDGIDWMTWCGGGPLDNEVAQ